MLPGESSCPCLTPRLIKDSRTCFFTGTEFKLMKTTHYILSAFTVWVLLLTSLIKLDSIAASLFENNWFNFPYKKLVCPRGQEIGI